MALDDITKRIDARKGKGYLSYKEVNALIPHDVHSPEDLDDLLTTIGTQGIDVVGSPTCSSAPIENLEPSAVLSLCDVQHDKSLTQVVALGFLLLRKLCLLRSHSALKLIVGEADGVNGEFTARALYLLRYAERQRSSGAQEGTKIFIRPGPAESRTTLKRLMQ